MINISWGQNGHEVFNVGIWWFDLVNFPCVFNKTNKYGICF